MKLLAAILHLVLCLTPWWFLPPIEAAHTTWMYLSGAALFFVAFMVAESLLKRINDCAQITDAIGIITMAIALAWWIVNAIEINGDRLFSSLIVTEFLALMGTYAFWWFRTYVLEEGAHAQTDR